MSNVSVEEGAEAEGEDDRIEPWDRAWKCVHCGLEHVISELTNVVEASARAYFCPTAPHTEALFRIVKDGDDYRWDVIGRGEN